MNYLKEHLDIKKTPTQHFKGFVSAIVIAKPYFPTSTSPTSLRMAQYAKSPDYHLHFRNDLERIKQSLLEKFCDHEFLCFTDSVPLLERDLAAQAGLGWVGKNTCLIDRKKGSLFFIGEILSSLPLENPTPLVSDFCGHCTRCIEACPTQALGENRTLYAKRCIAYLNIESKSTPPLELRPSMQDWFFGCDICQTVCPWNEKAHGKDLMRSLSQEKLNPMESEFENDKLKKELQLILQLSNKKLIEHFKDYPLTRARGFGLKRNALIAIGNLKIKELEESVRLTARQWPRLQELCDWVLERLASP